MKLKAAFSWKERLFLLDDIFKIVCVKKLREKSLLYLMIFLYIINNIENAYQMQ